MQMLNMTDRLWRDLGNLAAGDRDLLGWSRLEHPS